MIGVVAKSVDESAKVILDLRLPEGVSVPYTTEPIASSTRFDALVFCDSVSADEAERMASVVAVRVGQVYTLSRVTTTKLDEEFGKLRRLGELVE